MPVRDAMKDMLQDKSRVEGRALSSRASKFATETLYEVLDFIL
jgi:hypothetical protein